MVWPRSQYRRRTFGSRSGERVWCSDPAGRFHCSLDKRNLRRPPADRNAPLNRPTHRLWGERGLQVGQLVSRDSFLDKQAFKLGILKHSPLVGIVSFGRESESLMSRSIKSVRTSAGNGLKWFHLILQITYPNLVDIHTCWPHRSNSCRRYDSSSCAERYHTNCWPRAESVVSLVCKWFARGSLSELNRDTNRGQFGVEIGGSKLEESERNRV